jgi:hypothetical protein
LTSNWSCKIDKILYLNAKKPKAIGKCAQRGFEPWLVIHLHCHIHALCAILKCQVSIYFGQYWKCPHPQYLLWPTGRYNMLILVHAMAIIFYLRIKTRIIDDDNVCFYRIQAVSSSYSDDEKDKYLSIVVLFVYKILPLCYIRISIQINKLVTKGIKS